MHALRQCTTVSIYCSSKDFTNLLGRLGWSYVLVQWLLQVTQWSFLTTLTIMEASIMFTQSIYIEKKILCPLFIGQGGSKGGDMCPPYREFLNITRYFNLFITNSRVLHENIFLLPCGEYSRRLPCFLPTVYAGTNKCCIFYSLLWLKNCMSMLINGLSLGRLFLKNAPWSKSF